MRTKGILLPGFQSECNELPIMSSDMLTSGFKLSSSALIKEYQYSHSCSACVICGVTQESLSSL